jgi:PAS domain S-box-containing protein
MAERMNGFQKADASAKPAGSVAPRKVEPGLAVPPAASHDSRDGYRVFLDKLPIGVYRIAPEGHLTYANEAMIGLLGASSLAELESKNPKRRHFETEYTLEWLAERMRNEGDEVRGLESTWKTRGGTVRVRENMRAVRDGNGRISCFECTVEDFSDKKEMEESLRAKADFLEEVVTNATVGIFVIDEDNKYVLINPECGRIVGHWPDDWTGREAGLHVHPEDAGKAMAHFIQAITGEQNDFEVRIEASGGSYKHCRINLSPMMLGEKAHVLGVVSDVTEKKNSEETLLERRAQSLNIILLGAMTQMAMRIPPDELEASMKDFERWFGERFERMFEEDMELISGYETPGEKVREGPELVVRRYMRYFSSLLGIFGVRTECTYGPSSSTFEMLGCAWLPESRQSPVPCRVCKTILCGSFEWTGLEGFAEQVATIAGGSETCKFVFKPGPPRRRPAV